ncbi:hypothetical protein [Methylosarcina fibrata]|uniref:hypothetical protein n=1 Tax=Methylosarcina fibrata TaxID=105972 RepID=UPI0003632436|nr:hypothetical protein [Methylosarcina fibrata]
MLLFIAASLALSFIVQTESPLRDILASPVFIYIGLSGAVLAIVGMMLKRGAQRLWYEFFFISSLITWYAYWQPIFGRDSPMFFFFPIFFAGMTVFVSLVFINQRDKLDQDTLHRMRLLSGQAGLQPWILMICVLASLELQDHYLVYPILTTILLLRFSLSSCCEAL